MANSRSKTPVVPDTGFKPSDLISTPMEIALLAVVTLLPILLFWPAVGYGLVWDDITIHLTENPFLHPPSVDNLIHFWKMPYQQLYIPLAYTVWWFFFKMGMDSSAVFHLINIVLHTANGILVYCLIRRLIKHPLPAIAGCLIFVFHPIQVESVAWLSEFRGLGASFLGLISLHLYLSSSRKNCLDDSSIFLSGRFWGGWICFTLGLLLKPSIVVIPLFAAMIDFACYRPILVQILKRITVFVLPIIAITLVTAQVQSSGQGIGILSRLLVWGDTINFYLYKVVFPMNLAVSYARTPEWVLSQWWIYYAWMLPAAIGIGLWKLKKRMPLLVLSFSLFLAGFLPVSGLVDFTFQSWSTVADRYLYLSMAGTALLVAYLAASIHHKWQSLLMIVILGMLIARTAIAQLPVWQNEITLWSHCIEVTPEEFRAYENRGRNYAVRKAFSLARIDLDTAIRMRPKEVFRAWYNRGLINDIENRLDDALADYNKAIEIQPDDPKILINRGVVLGKKQNYHRAMADFNRAIAVDPDNADAYINRALAFCNLGDFQAAMADMVRARGLGGSVDPELFDRIKQQL